jgi:hypothetical protein
MKKTVKYPVYGFILLLFLTRGSVITAQQFTSSNLPIVVINTNGQIIPDDYKITADMGIIYNGPGVRNNLSDPFNHYNGKIGIELRGSTSQMFPKKPYGIETRDSTGEDLDVSILGMPLEADWILNATYNDKTLMRDVMAYDIARATGRYASRTRYCEMVLNGEYVGIYIIMERIKNDKNRVDIKKMDPEDTTGDALTGGYILKFDKTDGEDNLWWTSPYPPYPGSPFPVLVQYHVPKPSSIVQQQKDYIRNHYTNFETIMNSALFDDPEYGYPKWADENSLADFFLINEFAKNVDGYRLSSFIYKDRDSRNPRYVMGPVWDFNIAFGNANYYSGAPMTWWELDVLTTDQTLLTSDQFQVPFWWKKLRNSPRFLSTVKDRWNLLKTTAFSKERIFGVIDSLTAYLNEARQRNFQKWPVLGQYVWPNPYVGQTCEDELNYFKNWINGRSLWMNNAISQFTDISDQEPMPGEYLIARSYPNPFNPSTTVQITTSVPGEVKAELYGSSGEKAGVLFDQFAEAGKHSFMVDALKYNLSSGVWFVVVTLNSDQAGYQRVVQKIMLLK